MKKELFLMEYTGSYSNYYNWEKGSWVNLGSRSKKQVDQMKFTGYGFILEPESRMSSFDYIVAELEKRNQKSVVFFENTYEGSIEKRAFFWGTEKEAQDYLIKIN